MEYYAYMLKLFRRTPPERRDAVMEFAAFLRAHRQAGADAEATLSGPGPTPAQSSEVPAPANQTPPAALGAESPLPLHGTQSPLVTEIPPTGPET